MLLAAPELTAADHDVLGLIADQHRRLRLLSAVPRRWRGVLRQLALARAVRGSNIVDGAVVSVDDAFAALADEQPLAADEPAWRAVLGYRDATAYVRELAEDPLLLSTDTIRALHFVMRHYDLTARPGRWRADPAVVPDAAETACYVAPPAAEVPALMAELVDGVNADTGRPLLVRAALAHLNLVLIHPFRDGNGRMARCLQTLLLACGGLLPAPEFASVEEYLGRHARDYHRVLAEVGGGSWQPDRDTTVWLRFCLTAHHRQALRVERRDLLAARLWEYAADIIGSHGLPERCVDLLAFGLTGRVLRNSTYRQLVPDVSHNLASRDFTELVRAGLLEPIGEKRGRRYVPSEGLRTVAGTVRDEVHREFPVTGDPYRIGATT